MHTDQSAKYSDDLQVSILQMPVDNPPLKLQLNYSDVMRYVLPSGLHCPFAIHHC